MLGPAPTTATTLTMSRLPAVEAAVPGTAIAKPIIRALVLVRAVGLTFAMERTRVIILRAGVRAHRTATAIIARTGTLARAWEPITASTAAPMSATTATTQQSGRPQPATAAVRTTATTRVRRTAQLAFARVARIRSSHHRHRRHRWRRRRRRHRASSGPSTKNVEPRASAPARPPTRTPESAGSWPRLPPAFATTTRITSACGAVTASAIAEATMIVSLSNLPCGVSQKRPPA